MRPVSGHEWIGIAACCAAVILPPVVLTPLLPPEWVIAIGFILMFPAGWFLARVIMSGPD